METTFVIILFLCALLIDYFPSFKKTENKKKIVNGSIYILTFIVLILFTFKITVPSPSDFIKMVIESIFGKIG